MKFHQPVTRNNSTRTIHWLSLLAALCCACASDKEAASGGNDAAIAVPEIDAEHDAGAGHPSARQWIEEEFSEDRTMTGEFSSRQNIEMPVLVRDETNTASKYAFQARDAKAPNDRRVGFINVEISNLESLDAFGSGISTRNEDPGTELFIAEVTIEPNWPTWVNYETTNYDGLTLDSSAAIYAEKLTVRNWNGDAALDIKSEIAQFVRLTTDGSGHRTLRIWKSGPHYLVDSSINNAKTVGRGSLLWFSDCDAATVYVYATTFNGEPTLNDADIECDNGTNPNIVYLDQDPRQGDNMHPMFR